MTVSERLFNVAMPIWESYFEHPFVKGIADGTLPIEKFRFYMIQDHKYLMQYAKVFALGVVKAKKESDMRLFSSMVTATLDTENAVHQSYMAKLGITREDIDNTPMCINNESYTNYMISIASKGGLSEICAAVLACSASYMLIGKHIEENYPEALNNPLYANWVQTYTSEEFRGFELLVQDMTNRFTANCTEEELQELERVVLLCSDYEYQFWDMAYTMGESYSSR